MTLNLPERPYHRYRRPDQDGLFSFTKPLKNKTFTFNTAVRYDKVYGNLYSLVVLLIQS